MQFPDLRQFRFKKRKLLKGRERSVSEQKGSDYGFSDAFAVSGNRDGNSGCSVNLPRFVQQNPQNDSINWVIATVKQNALDFLCRLPETVNTTVSLLKPVWVPWQVIVDDRCEVFLQVDALT
jgi:hypothetical protein